MKQSAIDVYRVFNSNHGRNIASVASTLEENGSMTVVDLCSKLYMTGSLVEKCLKSLVEWGDVKKIADYSDLKASDVYQLRSRHEWNKK
jgi:predicted transcriptional regulator